MLQRAKARSLTLEIAIRILVHAPSLNPAPDPDLTRALQVFVRFVDAVSILAFPNVAPLAPCTVTPQTIAAFGQNNVALRAQAGIAGARTGVPRGLPLLSCLQMA